MKENTNDRIMTHTPEPWFTEYRKNKDGMFYQEVFDKHGEPIAQMNWYPVKLNSTTTGTNRAANAKRIVACVNACAGMTSEELEGGLLLKVMNDKITRLETEKLELLKALEGMLDIVGDSAGVAGYHRNGDVAEWDEFDEVGEAYETFKKLEVKE